MTVSEISPTIDRAQWLAGAQFADAFSVTIDGPAIDARTAAERMLGRSPRWVELLLKLRNVLVAPFGLKSSGAGETAKLSQIGIFPVISETRERLVAGFNDHHLDFRLVIDVAAHRTGQQVTATTLVLMHNRLGRAYLALILPFHRLVVRSMLRQVTSASV
jgi:hypothetical protein